MKALLKLFNLREIESKIYEILFYGGIMSAGQIAKQTDISRTSVYDLLEKLIDLGLVIETTELGVKRFAVQPPTKLQLLLNEKQKEILSAGKTLDYLQQEYLNKHKTPTPRLQLFEGRQALQQMMKDMLLYRDTTVQAYWPVKKLIKLLTQEFLMKFHRERVERNIKIKAIWPQNQIPSIKDYPFLQVSPKLKREVRIAPRDINFSLGYAVYGNTVRFISSSRENFGFLVESEELAEMMKSQFEIIWSLSKPFNKV